MTDTMVDTTSRKDMDKVEAFFSNPPTLLLREKMRETVVSFIDQMELDGKRISEIKDKKVMPGKIACALRDMKVDGWVDLDHYHLYVHSYPMYKALYDLFNTELKAKLTIQKTPRTDEVATSSKNSP